MGIRPTKDFFVSYTSSDRSWAEWVAWQLEEAGYTTVIQAWDSRPGKNFVLWMSETATRASRTIAILSQDYLDAPYAQSEWAAAFRLDPRGEKGTLIPVRVEDCDVTGLLPTITYIDLVGMEEPGAKKVLLNGVKLRRAKPIEQPRFPRASKRSISIEPEYPGFSLGRSVIKGLRSFEFEDAEIFTRLQREHVLRECLETITHADFRFGFLYGESGCGKSSFLQAGIWPMVNNHSESHHCIYVKFTDLDPFETIRAAVCDQTEICRDDADDLNLRAILQKGIEAHNKSFVLLFDQFEQFFIHHQQKAQRESFTAAMAEWYRQDAALPVHILLCIQSGFVDRLFELQEAMGYTLGPQDAFRLEKFTPVEATEIFQVMAEIEGLAFDRHFVERMTAEELADRGDGLISPVDIQILAWMIQGQERGSGFNKAVYRKVGGIEGLLQNFLSRAMASIVPEARKEVAVKVMLALVDLDRNVRAGVLTVSEVYQRLRHQVSKGEIQASLDWLGQSKVRLVTSHKRHDTRGYELVHERLIPALRRLAGKELTTVEQANLLLTQRVNEWLVNNRSSRFLLSFRDFLAVSKQRPYLEWGNRKKQKQELLRRSQTRLLRRGGTVALSLSFIITLSVFGLKKWERERTLAAKYAQLIGDKLALVHGTIERRFGQAERDMLLYRAQYKSWASSAMIGNAASDSDVRELVARANAFFVPLIARHSSLSSLMVARGGGFEYLLFQDPDCKTIFSPPCTHYNRIVQQVDGPAVRIFFDGELEQRWDTLNVGDEDERHRVWRGYNVTTRRWFLGAPESEEDRVSWTNPYLFFVTREPGITGSVTKNVQGEPLVIAFDYLLGDLSEYTIDTSISGAGTSGIAFVATDSGHVVGLPRDQLFLNENLASDRQKIRQFFSRVDQEKRRSVGADRPLDALAELPRVEDLKGLVSVDPSVLARAFEMCQKSGNERVASFVYGGKRYWTRARTLKLSEFELLIIGVVWEVDVG